MCAALGHFTGVLLLRMTVMVFVDGFFLGYLGGTFFLQICALGSLQVKN